MKKNTILDLYNRFADEIYDQALKNNKLSNEILFLENKLIESLSEEQKEVFDKINAKRSEQEELIYKEMFISAFSLATRLFVEGLKEN